MKKPEPRYAVHKIFGRGEVLSVRSLDGGALIADMRFEDGSERTMRLAPQYWTSGISDLLPTPLPMPKRVRKQKARGCMRYIA